MPLHNLLDFFSALGFWMSFKNKQGNQSTLYSLKINVAVCMCSVHAYAFTCVYSFTARKIIHVTMKIHLTEK